MNVSLTTAGLFANFLLTDLKWNAPKVTWNEKEQRFEYQGASGQSLVKTLKELCDMYGFYKVKVERVGDTRRDADGHEYFITIQQPSKKKLEEDIAEYAGWYAMDDRKDKARLTKWLVDNAFKYGYSEQRAREVVAANDSWCTDDATDVRRLVKALYA